MREDEAEDEADGDGKRGHGEGFAHDLCGDLPVGRAKRALQGKFAAAFVGHGGKRGVDAQAGKQQDDNADEAHQAFDFVQDLSFGGTDFADGVDVELRVFRA